jgi:hypothetical protein
LRIGSMAVAKPPALLFAFHPVSSFTKETGSRFETTIKRVFPLINFMVSYAHRDKAAFARRYGGEARVTLTRQLETGAEMHTEHNAHSLKSAASRNGRSSANDIR